jgi:hypothetical protein
MKADLEVFSTIANALEGLDPEDQCRTLEAIITLLKIPFPSTKIQSNKTVDNSQKSELLGHFSENRSMSPKEFVREKSPQKDTDRIACLAYYLTHYKDTPHFKTLDLSTLNTEAAQPKFSNAAVAVDNATKAGLLVPAVKGKKQLSAAGELFVQALPDRDQAKKVLQANKSKRKPRKTQPKSKT